MCSDCSGRVEGRSRSSAEARPEQRRGDVRVGVFAANRDPGRGAGKGW